MRKTPIHYRTKDLVVFNKDLYIIARDISTFDPEKTVLIRSFSDIKPFYMSVRLNEIIPAVLTDFEKQYYGVE